jgi:hypothetical protein
MVRHLSPGVARSPPQPAWLERWASCAQRCERIATTSPAALPVPSTPSDRRPAAAFVLFFALTASGCMVVPRTTSSYNSECQVVERRVTLEAQQVGAIGRCQNSAECTGLLAIYGLVAAGSAVVSGSVAIAGNVAYWLEERAQCVRAGTENLDPKRASAPGSAPVASAPT